MQCRAVRAFLFLATCLLPSLIFAQSSQPSADNTTGSDRTFIVHFALDSARINAKGLDVIRNAAILATQQAATRVQVVGHADQLGTPEYNIILSRRRTAAVIRALQRQGISAALLSGHWKGEFESTVPESVSESMPANRRVEITIFF